MNTPNKITIARIAVTPVLPWLIVLNGVTARVVAFVVFVLAAVSDVVDGRLARGNDEITRFGQLLDPIADKLLVLVTLLPLYGLGLLPLWVVVVVLSREVIITVFRGFALGHGQAIAASGWGKAKALVQSWFVGSILVGRINAAIGSARGVDGGAWAHWQGYTQAVIDVGLWFAVILTVGSLLDCLRRHRGCGRARWHDAAGGVGRNARAGRVLALGAWHVGLSGVALLWWATAPGLAVTLGAAVLLGAVGVPLADRAERALGPDDGRIVIDEAAGMALALAGATPGAAGALVALVWFRLFDIFKPPPVRQAEHVAGGAGVLLDDVVAGALAAAAAAGTLWIWRHVG